MKRNAINIVTHPIRTVLSIGFTTLLFGVLYTIMYDSGAVATVDAAQGNSLAMALAILPPLPILALIALAMTILVPITMLFRGVGDDNQYYR